MTISIDQLHEVIGAKLLADDGSKIGKVDEVYLNRNTEQPEWITTHTGMFGNKLSFVPIVGATFTNGEVQVAFTEDQVKGAPNIDADGSLSDEEEVELYRYYGMAYANNANASASGTEGYDSNTDDAMTRSEEEMRVGTQSKEVGRARLRKYVVTEQRTVTVPVRHEEVRLETEPITDANRAQANSGPSISEEEHEVILHAEEPVVQTEVVAKERVRLATTEVTENEEVSADLRQERIEVEGDTSKTK